MTASGPKPTPAPSMSPSEGQSHHSGAWLLEPDLAAGLGCGGLGCRVRAGTRGPGLSICVSPHDVEVTGSPQLAVGSAGPACCRKVLVPQDGPPPPGTCISWCKVEGKAGLLGQEWGEPEMVAAEGNARTSLPSLGLGLRGAHAVTPGDGARATVFLSEIRAQHFDSVVTVSEPKRTRTRVAPDSPPLTTFSLQSSVGSRWKGNQKVRQAVVSALALWDRWEPVQAPHAHTQWVSTSGPGVGAAGAPAAGGGMGAACTPRKMGAPLRDRTPSLTGLRVSASPKQHLPQAPLAGLEGRKALPFLRTHELLGSFSLPAETFTTPEPGNTGSHTDVRRREHGTVLSTLAVLGVVVAVAVATGWVCRSRCPHGFPTR